MFQTKRRGLLCRELSILFAKFGSHFSHESIYAARLATISEYAFLSFSIFRRPSYEFTSASLLSHSFFTWFSYQINWSTWYSKSGRRQKRSAKLWNSCIKGGKRRGKPRWHPVILMPHLNRQMESRAKLEQIGTTKFRWRHFAKTVADDCIFVLWNLSVSI